MATPPSVGDLNDRFSIPEPSINHQNKPRDRPQHSVMFDIDHCDLTHTLNADLEADDDVILEAVHHTTTRPLVPTLRESGMIRLPNQLAVDDAVCQYQVFGALRSTSNAGLPIPMPLTGVDLPMISEHNGTSSIYRRPLWALSIVAGMLAIWALYPLRQMTVQYFFDYHKTKREMISLLLPWCNVLSVLIGIASDAMPLFHYRRKTYLAAGYGLASVAGLAMAIVYALFDPAAQVTWVLLLLLLCTVTLGLQVTWVILLAVSVELAQHEMLHHRGRLQTMLFALYFTGMWTTQIVVASILHPNIDGNVYTSEISLGGVAMVLAVLALAPQGILFSFWREDKIYMQRPLSEFRARVHELWRLLSQKAVLNVLVALTLMVVFTAANNSNVNSVARFTSGFTGADVQWLYLDVYIPRALSALLWYQCFTNASWRTLACGGFAFVAALKSMTVIMLINDVMRGRVLYIVMFIFTQIPQGWISLFQVLPTTEIAYAGREATMIGLVQTCLALVSIGTTALWTWVQRVVDLNVSTKEIQDDTPRMRTKATLAAMLVLGFNALSITMVFFLPSQKLDAQQQRAFGGYHKWMRNAFVIGFGALLSFDLHNNISKLLKL